MVRMVKEMSWPRDGRRVSGMCGKVMPQFDSWLMISQ